MPHVIVDPKMVALAALAVVKGQSAMVALADLVVWGHAANVQKRMAPVANDAVDHARQDRKVADLAAKIDVAPVKTAPMTAMADHEVFVRAVPKVVHFVKDQKAQADLMKADLAAKVLVKETDAAPVVEKVQKVAGRVALRDQKVVAQVAEKARKVVDHAANVATNWNVPPTTKPI